MNLREQPRERQPFAGEQPRERPIVDERVGGPLNGHVRVVPVVLESRWTGPSGRRFSIEVEWDGPGLPELPPLEPGDRAHVNETYSVEDHELARAVATAAAEELRGGRVPNLRELAERFAQ